MSRPWVRLSEARRILGVSDWRWRKLVRRGTVRRFRLPGQIRWRYERRQLEGLRNWLVPDGSEEARRKRRPYRAMNYE